MPSGLPPSPPTSRPRSVRSAADDALVDLLAAAGCVAAEEEAAELRAAAGSDQERLAALSARRVAGEPLSWVTGTALFLGTAITVRPGVYVPRPQSEQLARRAIALLAGDGCAVDLCTGSGALAVVLARARPAARVVATDIDEAACACAAVNGVAVVRGDLAEPLLPALSNAVDVVTCIAPYVPTAALVYLPRDVREHEPSGALDGGHDGTDVLLRVVDAAARLLCRGGHLLLECGAGQPALLAPALVAAGFAPAEILVDEENDVRGLIARAGGGRAC